MSANAIEQSLMKMAKEALAGKTVQWPNVKFEPPTNALWFRVFYMPADRHGATLGELGEDEIDGFLQIDVNVPTNSGEKLMREELDKLEKVFIAGAKASYSTSEASILACKRSPGRDVDGFYRVSLTVDFYGRIQRPPLTTP